MANERIVSIHIEKTGGTSMMRFFCDLYGPHNVFFYHPRVGFRRQDEDSAHTRRTIIGDIVKDIVRRYPRVYRAIRTFLHSRESKSSSFNVPQHFSVIHGHFAYGAIEIPGARYATVLREPQERCRSHFDDIHKWNQVVHRAAAQLSYPQFAFHESFVNFQAKRVGGLELSAFTYIGTTNNLNEYCRLFDSHGKVKLHKLNKTQTPSSIVSDADFTARFVKAHALDYQLYSTAMSFQVRRSNEVLTLHRPLSPHTLMRNTD
jgi:hypothetical protein